MDDSDCPGDNSTDDVGDGHIGRKPFCCETRWLLDPSGRKRLAHFWLALYFFAPSGESAEPKNNKATFSDGWWTRGHCPFNFGGEVDIRRCRRDRKRRLEWPSGRNAVGISSGHQRSAVTDDGGGWKCFHWTPRSSEKRKLLTRQVTTAADLDIEILDWPPEWST
jgi:hypothetical protein